MTEKRFSIKAGSSIGLSSIYTDNGKVMTQLEVLDVLIKQHETIQTLTKENEYLKVHFKKMEKLFQSTNKENVQLKQSNERLLKLLDNVANYMQRENKHMPIDDFVEWWNGIATEDLDGDVE